MSEKRIDVSQITSVNIASGLNDILYGKYGELNSSLLNSIKSGDASKAAIQESCSAVSGCSDNLTNAITQMNDYVNAMAEAFQQMDQEISQKFNTTVSDIRVTSHGESNSRPNKYKGQF